MSLFLYLYQIGIIFFSFGLVLLKQIVYLCFQKPSFDHVLRLKLISDYLFKQTNFSDGFPSIEPSWKRAD